MNESIISVRYSRALFQSALEKKILDKVLDDMHLVLEVCRIPEATELLGSPIIVPSRKIAALRAVLGGRVQELTLALTGLLVENGREKHLPAVARNFIHETMKHKGVTESLLTTAVRTDDKIKGEISRFVSDKFNTKVELKDNVDPEIIGGFILRIGDKYIDASIRSKLRKISKELRGSIKS
ncbi:MAG: ATP synthase F1 subunit delta [Bacteroidales bacterium]|jgi:F-type H+-transporting ATPase subunit delta|nr:ATP synthase F1 subunit delta [Bacteroidales bacterium]